MIRLYTALGGLRVAYSGDTSENGVDGSFVGSALGPNNGVGSGVGTGVGSGVSRSSLCELISRSRTSLEPKKRLAAVQWGRALFMWDPLVLETMILLAGDTNANPVVIGAIGDSTSCSPCVECVLVGMAACTLRTRLASFG